MKGTLKALKRQRGGGWAAAERRARNKRLGRTAGERLSAYKQFKKIRLSSPVVRLVSAESGENSWKR